LIHELILQPIRVLVDKFQGGEWLKGWALWLAYEIIHLSFGSSAMQRPQIWMAWPEVGDKFPTEKQFCSWLGLATKHEISGGKVSKNNTLKTKNRAGQAFRMAAQSVKQADCSFGAMYRRLRAV